MNVPAPVPAVPPPPRLPMPAYADCDPVDWRVYVEAIFPNARSAEAVMLALAYCRKRGLDPMKHAVNIVSMWNSALGREVETVWPSINEVQVTAARTGAWAGMDPPQWGPEKTQTFRGRKRVRGQWVDAEIPLTFPEWCSVTVYRIVGNQRVSFVEPVYWAEAYGRVGGGELPNDMWARRPRGQLLKVAKAMSLRAAFPEESDYSDEEMAGGEAGPPDAPRPADNWSPPSPSPTSTSSPSPTPTPPPAASPSPPPAPPPTTTPTPAATASAAPTSAPTPSPSSAPTPTPDYGPEPPPPDGPDDGLDVDPETGEIAPQEIPLGEQEEWRSWGARFLNAIQPLQSVAGIEAWEKANHLILTQMEAHAPKIHVRLVAAVKKRKLDVAPGNPLAGG